MQQKIAKPEKHNRYFVFVGIFIVMIATGIFLFAMVRQQRIGTQAPNAALHPDTLISAALSNGDHLVHDETGGYSFVLPSSWYLEKNEGSGVTVYPGYHPDAGSSPECKIEVSVFKDVATADMTRWVADHLREDPTVAITEMSSQGVSVIGAQAAFEWTGTMDGIATTLAYVSAEGNIYEIAPSALDIQKADGNAVCDTVFAYFMDGIRFGDDTK